MHSAYALPQLRHYYTVYPAKETNKVFKWQTIASILLCRWTGRSNLPISFSEASWTGLLNIQSCKWDETALHYLPKQCQEALPTLKDCIDSDAVLGGIRQYTLASKDKDGKKKQNPYWKRWPELRGLSSVDNCDEGQDDAIMALSSGGCRLFLGVADGACANVGSKCTTTSRIAVTIGTSAAARMCIPAPANESQHMISVPSGLWCYRITKNQLLLGGALSDGGSVVQWAKNLLNLNDGSSFERCMKDVECLMKQETTNCSKQTTSTESFAPFLNGERSTGYRAGATGALIGLTSSTTPASFLKACLEGVTLRLNAIILRIISAAHEDERVAQSSPILVVSGTALEKNGAWRRMISDASQLKVLMDEDVRESTSRGAARLAAGAVFMDLFGSAYQSVMKDEPLEAIDTQNPNPNMRHKWDAKTQTQDTLIESVSVMW
jgi:gluconokinase